MLTPQLTDLLTKFSQAHGTSGYEDNIRALVVREFKKLADEVQITPLGSVIGIKRAPVKRGARRANGTPRILIEAHMDEIGLLVTEIQDGFIRFDEIGMFDPRVLPSQNVMVHGRKPLPGVIGARPPHVLSAQDRAKSIPLGDLFIDVGMSDENVRQVVSVGDFITLDRSVIHLQNDFVAGKAFDDRSSLVAILEMLRQLQNVNHAWDVYAVANVNEEDSATYIGAWTSTYAIRPQLALCLDVTHAQQPGLHQDHASRVSFGPCIARGANVHPVVFEKLRASANRKAIPHHITVYGDDTQTNGWMMQVAGEGVPTGLVEIPLRYMHTSVETIHLEDVAHTAELLANFVTGLTAQDSNDLQGETFVRTASGPKTNGTSKRTSPPRRPKRAAKPKRRTRK
jgi:tetrahedral aminopeptidase